MRKKFLMSLFLFAMPSKSFAHGEDKLGPNSGFVRMPGAFHTEVVLDGKYKAKIYLLDMQWTNPSIKESSVTAELATKQKANCTVAEEKFFLCTFSKSVDLTKKGKLTVKAQREGQMGNEATYELPLRLFKAP